MTVLAVVRDVLVETRIVALQCHKCGVDYGLGEEFIAQRRRDKGTFYCPNGHGTYYPGKTDLEKERDRLANRLRWTSENLAASRTVAKAADYRARAAKGQLTRFRKRIANGVCPCCNRSFANVLAHMSSEHPDFAIPEAAS